MQLARTHTHTDYSAVSILYRSVIQADQPSLLDSRRRSGVDQRPYREHQVWCQCPESRLLRHGWTRPLPDEQGPDDRNLWPATWITPPPESAGTQDQIWYNCICHVAWFTDFQSWHTSIYCNCLNHQGKGLKNLSAKLHTAHQNKYFRALCNMIASYTWIKLNN